MASSGNFCVWNPLRVNQQTQTFAEGNLRFSSTQTSTNPAVTGTFGVTSGKWYWEIKIVAQGNASNSVGVCRTSAGLEDDTGALWNATGDVVFMYLAGGNKRTNGTSSSYGNSWTTGDILQVALDMDNGAVYFGKNNTFQNSGDPTSGSSKTGAAFTNLADKGHIQPYSLVYNNGDQVVNFGQDDTFGGRETAAGNADANGEGVFKYAPPSGYLALCSANLPISDGIDPAQTDDNYPSKQFNVVTYTGTGSTRSVTGLNFQPDLLWLKCRSIDQSARLIDSTRGVSKTLTPADTQAEQTESAGVTSFDSDGFTIGSATGGFNTSSATYVAWCWRANGGTEVTNNDGTGTSYVQANQNAGFSIVRYAGTGSALTIGHGLSQEPDITMIKDRDASVNWIVYNKLVDGSLDYFFLNTTAAKGDSGLTGPNDSIWNFNSASSYSNTSGRNYIMYNWHSVEGYSKFGKFEGNSNADGPFVYTGFRPRLVFCKSADASENWQVRDTARSTFNADSQVRIYWNSDAAEGSASTASPIDFLSNGFKVRGSNSEINTNTIVYGAWGDVPAKYGNTF